jgi:ZIP family zinc transporter
MLVIFAILPFFSTALGGLAALRLRHRLDPLMAFAAGLVVATALADLLPEATKLVGESAGRLPVATAAVAGFLAFSAVDALIHAQSWARQQRDAGPGDGAEPVPNPLGLARAIGMIVHSALDGVAIGLGFRASPEVGLLVAIAVLAHDFADGMNVVTLALAAGHGQRTAATLLIVDALAPPVGAAVASLVSLSTFALGLLLGVFAGVFLAIGAGHLLPEAQQRRPGIAPALVAWASLGALVALGAQSVLG